MNSHTKKKGFTLVETLASLVILGVVISIVMFNIASSTRREDIRYFQSGVNISNRMEMINAITSTVVKDNVILKTDYTLNDIGYYSVIEGQKQYVVNCNNYGIKINGKSINIDYIDGYPTKPVSYEKEKEVNGVKTKSTLPAITVADTLIYSGFYVKAGNDAETLNSTITHTFNKNIDTIEILNLNQSIANTNHLTKFLSKDDVKTMQYLYTTNETVEYTRSLSIMKKDIAR